MKTYILSDVVRKTGIKHYQDIYELTWVDIESLEVLITIVDTTYRNYTRSHWDQIVTKENPLGIYTGLRRTEQSTQDQLQVISADSYPSLVEPLTEAEVVSILQVRQEQQA